MERIVVLSLSTRFDRNTVEFACYLATVTGSMLTGLFFNSEAERETSEISLPGVPVVGQVVARNKIQLEHKVDHAEEVKKQFVSYCDNRGLRRKPDLIDVNSKEELLLESRFADLFVISADVSWNDELESVPTTLVEEVLKKAECPVMIAPLSFSGANEIVFAYDGSASSVYAIRQFTHLFPQMQEMKVTYLEVNEDSETKVEYREKITNYLKMHYSMIGSKILIGNAENELFSYFLGKKGVIVVMGAYGRKFAPSFFRHSTANLLLKTTSLPLFIAHH